MKSAISLSAFASFFHSRFISQGSKEKQEKMCVCVLDIHPVEIEKEREAGRERERGGEIDLF